MLTEQHLRSILQINTLIIKTFWRATELEMRKTNAENNCEGKANAPRTTKRQNKVLGTQ